MDWVPGPSASPTKRSYGAQGSSPLSELSPSPTKKPRTLTGSQSSSPSQPGSQPTATSPLQSLKVAGSPQRVANLPEPLLADVLLFHLAQDALEQAALLTPRLSTRAQEGVRSSASYMAAVSDYRRLIAFAITSLRSVINLAEGKSSVEVIVKPEVELSSRCLLAELLMREVEGGTGEAEEVLAKGIMTAQKHDRLGDLKYRLHALQIELMLSLGDEKPAKIAISRHIQELSSGLPVVASLTQWLYHFHLLNIRVSSASSAIKELATLAQANGAETIVVVSQVISLHAAMLRRDSAGSNRLMLALAEKTGLPMQPSDHNPVATVDIPKPLARQICMLWGFYHLYFSGHVDLADKTFEFADAQDKRQYAGSEEVAWVKLESDAVIALDPLPRFSCAGNLFGAITFRKQIERSSRHALRFHDAAAESIKQAWHDPHLQLSTRLSGAQGAITDRQALQSLELHVQFGRLEVQICRSEFVEAKATLDAVIKRVESWQLWKSQGPRVVLVAGMLRQAMGQGDRAVQCYKAAAQAAATGSELEFFAQVCWLLARIGQGVPVRRLGDPTRRRGSPKRDVVNAEETWPDIGQLGQMATKLYQRCKANAGLPVYHLFADLLESIADPAAYDQPRKTVVPLVQTCASNPAALTLIKAILAAQYLWLPHKVIDVLKTNVPHTQYLGCAKPAKDAVGPPTEDKYYVGHASLGLWQYEQLVQLYEQNEDMERCEKAKEQVERHRRKVAERDALAEDVP